MSIHEPIVDVDDAQAYAMSGRETADQQAAANQAEATNTEKTWREIAVGSRVKRRGRYYTITSEEVDDHGMIHRHVVPDQAVELEFNDGEFDIAGYPDDPVGWDIQPPKEG